MGKHKAMFAGMAKAEVSSRLANPKEGKGWFLVNQVSLEESTRTKGLVYVQVKMTSIVPQVDGQGRVVGTDNYDGEISGTRVSKAIFSGDYFAKEMKSFILTGMGRTPEEAPEIEAEILAAMQAEGIAIEGDESEAVWSYIGEMVCGDAGKPGCFDGTVVLEVETKKNVKQTEEFVKNAAGEFVQKVKEYTNTYFQRLVSFEEVANQLDEKAIARFFGSTEHFMKLLTAEQAG